MQGIFIRMISLKRQSIAALSLLVLLACFPYYSYSQDEACFECHGDKDLTMERGGKEISIFVNAKIFASSIHAENGCVSCHVDADVEEFPHADDLAPVDCSTCHDDAVKKYE